MKHKLVRRVVALALSFTLALSLFAPVIVSANDDVVYQLATEDFIQSQAVGTRLPDGYDVWGPTSLLRVGPSSYHIVASPFGGNGIRIGDRANAWQGIDVQVGGSLGFEGQVTLSDAEYTIRIRGHINRNARLQLAGGDSPQSGFFGETVNGDFSVEHTFTLEDLRASGVHTRGHIRINTTDSTSDLTIHEIVIARGTSIPEGIGVAVAADDNGTAPVATTGGLATWQDVLDTGIFTAIRGHNTGSPVLEATANGLVVSNRGEPAFGEHDALGIHLTQLRALGEGRTPEIIISGTIEGTAAANRMYAQLFDGAPGRGADDWTRANIDADDASFTMVITNEPHGVPDWAGDWANRPWIGAHPRGDITVTSITIGGVSILEILGSGDVEIPEDEKLDLGFPEGVMYNLLQDSFIQDYDVGATVSFGTTPHLSSSGGTVTAVGNVFGGNALRFTNRGNEWDGLDIRWDELGLTDGEYSIQIIGNIELTDAFDHAEFAIAGSSSPWGWVGEEVFPDDATGDFEMVRPFSVADGEVVDPTNGTVGGSLRMRPMGTLNNFTLYQIAIVRQGTSLPTLPARTAVTTQTPATTGGVTIQLTIDSTTATVNGTAQTLNAAPFIAEGRTMVPFRFIGEAMGAEVDWTSAEGDSQGVAHFDDGTTTLDLPIGVALNDAAGVYMGTPILVDGRTFVPARFVAETFGAVITPALPNITISLGGGGAVAPPVTQPPVAGDGNVGISVANMIDGSSATGANIIIGSGIDSWPFADGPGGDERAFAPEQGGTYRVSFNVTNDGSGGWRVRWGRGTGLFGDARYTDADYAAVNNHAVAPDTVATVIPAHFNQNVSADGTYTLTLDVTLDGSESYNGLIGNIVLTGTAGSHDFVINWISVEQDGETLASWVRGEE